jgi:hypothetical protein
LNNLGLYLFFYSQLAHSLPSFGNLLNFHTAYFDYFENFYFSAENITLLDMRVADLTLKAGGTLGELYPMS